MLTDQQAALNNDLETKTNRIKTLNQNLIENTVHSNGNSDKGKPNLGNATITASTTTTTTTLKVKNLNQSFTFDLDKDLPGSPVTTRRLTILDISSMRGVQGKGILRASKC